MQNQTKNPTEGLNPEFKKEPDKFNSAEQGPMFDKVMRENMEEVLPDMVKDVLHLHLVNSEEIPDDLQHTKERKPDLLKKVTDAYGQVYILQVEYQRSDDGNMAARMAEYYIMLHRQYKLPINQHVIYIGAGSPTMSTTIITKDLKFRYKLTALSAVNHEVFLGSEKIEQRMLAILGKVPDENLERVLEQLLLDIESLDVGELTIGKYLTQLRVLLELRNFRKEILNNMALVGKIFEEEKDILYLRGEYKGEHKKALEIARQMLAEKEPLEKIARYTMLSIEELEAL